MKKKKGVCSRSRKRETSDTVYDMKTGGRKSSSRKKRDKKQKGKKRKGLAFNSHNIKRLLKE